MVRAVARQQWSRIHHCDGRAGMNRPVWAVEMIDTTELMERALAQGMRAGFSEDVIAQVFVAQHYSNLAY